MRANAAVYPSSVPEDLQVVGFTQLGAAWGVSERFARNILEEEGVPIICFGRRSRGARVSDVRAALKRREKSREGI